jgi:hypothetical protein
VSTIAEMRISFIETDNKSTKEGQIKTEVNVKKMSGSQKSVVIDIAKNAVVHAKVESWVIMLLYRIDSFVEN